MSLKGHDWISTLASEQRERLPLLFLKELTIMVRGLEPDDAKTASRQRIVNELMHKGIGHVLAKVDPVESLDSLVTYCESVGIGHIAERILGRLRIYTEAS